MPYFSGGPLRETPSTLLLALDAAAQSEAYGVTIYEDQLVVGSGGCLWNRNTMKNMTRNIQTFIKPMIYSG